ncbi:MAG: DUF4870 domain-containing protein [Microbacteriaceae bacterium]|nr:DUF4870 domain-containing protein [Microbacteriaceae bacterium]
MAVPLRPDEERNIAMLSHLISLVAIVLSASWVSALIFYLIYKDRGPFVRAHTATELNFQITMIIAAIAGAILSIVFIGFIVLIAVPIVMIVLGIIATIKANNGEWYTYPIAIRFVR